jgi:peroxiredoxin Q/BCP
VRPHRVPLLLCAQNRALEPTVSLEPTTTAGQSEPRRSATPPEAHIAEKSGSNEGEMVKNLDIGDAAPDFALPTDDGRSVSLRALRGGPTALYFYPKDDTAGCTAEAVAFNALRGEFEAAGATLIGVSPDSVASHVKFKRKHDLSLSLAADESKATLEAYGVWREKSMYGRKFMGVERTTFLIDPEGRIARIWRRVKVPGHAAEVLAAVKRLKAAFANG